MLRFLSIVMMTALAGLLLLLLAPSLPVLFGYQSYIVRSGSMEPTIPTGAVVVGRVVPLSSLRQGDIISFSSTVQTGVIVTHRLVGIEQNGGTTRFVTKGDANTTVDVGSIDTSKPVATVLYWVPWAGYLMAYLSLSAPGVRLLLVGCGLLLLWARLALGGSQGRSARGATAPLPGQEGRP